jgi:hypothetical protein
LPKLVTIVTVLDLVEQHVFLPSSARREAHPAHQIVDLIFGQGAALEEDRRDALDRGAVLAH